MKSRVLTTLLLTCMGLSLTAFVDEEKPCGHAHGEPFLRDMQPTSEQQKIDVRYYGLNFDMDIPTTSMTKAFVVKFVVLDTSLETIELDYSGYNLGVGDITVNTVILDGDTAAFTHSNDMLSIPLPATPDLNQLMTLEIFSQSGPASNQDNYGFNWDYESGQRSIWTKSQPYDARKWWPCVDYPRDKADSLDIVVSIADYMTVASNGRLISNIDNGDGSRTWHYHVSYPIATYLVSLSIYEFYVWGDIYVDANNDTLPIEFYTYSHPDNPSPSYMTTNYGLLPAMIELYAEQFGPYPFMNEKYGHAEWGENWGLEHQTLTSMGDPTERRVCHELAHMWYGDMITCHSYHHVWLNEGFARYAEALWWEERYGDTGYRSKMAELEYYGAGTIYVEDPETESIFSSNLSYNKPAWVLHTLRHILGEETFFEILQSYAADPRFKYGTATTEDFQMVCEEVSGVDLESFFQQWIYGQGVPIYRAYRGQTGQDLLIQVIQAGNTFDLPVDFRITTNLGVIDTTLRIDEQFMTFNFTLPEGEIVTGMVLDPGDWILNTATYIVGLAEDDFQGPAKFELFKNYPNPFNPQTTIAYRLDGTALTQLAIVDALGREVIELVNNEQNSGQYAITWNGLDTQGLSVESGLYFCHLRSGRHTSMQKLLLLK